MKLKLFLLLLLGLSSFQYLANAQSSISGTVKGNNTALAGANISVKPGNRSTTTDDNGDFSLKLNPGNYTVTTSYAGFQSNIQVLSLGESEQKRMDVVLLENPTDLDGLVIVGSRSLPRTAVNTPLPIDVLSAADLKTTGQISFDKQMQYRVPSFNTINTPVNDATTLLDPYEIRNLGPSRTLILINGKRKNLSSLLYVQFAPGRGETGADLAAIPVDAIKRVEILRDGASAQYGSDAIAGVMNVILKDRYQYSSLTINSGVTHKGDGSMYGLAFNSGSNMGDKGFINYTVDFSQQGNAVRSGTIYRPVEKAIFGGSPEADAAIDAYLNRFPTGNNTNGTGEISAVKFNFNLGSSIGSAGQFYANAGLVAKRASSNANFRTPYWRTDAGLLHKRVPGAPNYTGTTDTLYEGYLGYEPTFDGDLIDFHATAGVKNIRNGWTHDVSFTTGGNQQLYSVENTVNRSLGTASPTSFKPGGFGFYHFVGNYDISKSITDNFSLAFGTEARKETYKIVAGDTASYSGEGANSFPGIRAENATTNSRYNLGAYLDATLNATDAFLINGAVRAEKYSDFGSAFVWKLSSRYKISGNKAVIRASASTGFRAPSLHQIYAQSTQSSFVAGTIQLSGLFNNRSKQAFALGIPLLKPEKSTNFTVGVGLNPTNNFSLTLDYYDITIKDRVVYSSSISSNDPSTQLYQILQAANVVNMQVFINGIKTKTSGIDLVASYKNINFASGKIGLNLAGNYTLNNEIAGTPNEPAAIKAAGATILSTQIKSLLTESRPEYKAVFGIDFRRNKLGISLNNTLFGPTRFQDLDNGGPDMENIRQEFKPAVVTDLNAIYDFTKGISFSIGINNLLNRLPKWELKALNAAGKAVLDDPADQEALKAFLGFSGRYSILGYNGSQFSQLGTVFNASLQFKF